MMSSPNSERRQFEVDRRKFLQSSLIVCAAVASPGATRSVFAAGDSSDSYKDPKLYIIREEDGLFIELQAFGFYLRKSWWKHSLQRISAPKGGREPRFVFRFPPQHFMEGAIGVAGDYPDKIPTGEINRIRAAGLFESEPSQIVFKLPDEVQCLALDAETLLDWEGWSVVNPEFDKGEAYRANLPRLNDPSNPVTKIELPWGVYLQPVSEPLFKSKVPAVSALTSEPEPTWKTRKLSGREGRWNELWSSRLMVPMRPAEQMKFEMLDVRGLEFTGIKTDPISGVDVACYKTPTGQKPPEKQVNDPNGFPVTVTGFDRLELLGSLSRRFPYTGDPAPNGKSSTQLAWEDKVSQACYSDNQFLNVNNFTLTPLGGSLSLDAKWDAFPGCRVSGWQHEANLGRDNYVRIVRAGYLYPFGVPARLVILSERAFIQDEFGHYVAPLLKQAFIEIPQPNTFAFDHLETPFAEISVVTDRTPPLDLPKKKDPQTGTVITVRDPAEYANLDFFVPTVDGEAFMFEHVGIDHDGRSRESRMGHVFVSNFSLAANGLIEEPGGKAGRKPDQRTALSLCGATTGDPSPKYQALPENMFTSPDGLRKVDKLWMKEAFRFASYGKKSIAMAPSESPGDTSQTVDWIEWTRGKEPELDPVTSKAPVPFQARVRTAKIKFDGVSQFSGQDLYALATYRDTRYMDFPVLDPEPTAHDPAIYNRNLLGAFEYGPRKADSFSPGYLHILGLTPVIASISAGVYKRNATDGVLNKEGHYGAKSVLDVYYGTTTADTIYERRVQALLGRLNNEVQFGLSESADATGGLAVPDSYVTLLSREYGPVGDAFWDPRKYLEPHKIKEGVAARRVDYAYLRQRFPKKPDAQPFDLIRDPADLTRLVRLAESAMGYDEALVAAVSPRITGVGDRFAFTGFPATSLGDIFGSKAEILPGLSLSKLFEDVALTNTDSETALSGLLDDLPEKSSEPMRWSYRVDGIDWLLEMVGPRDDQLTFPELTSMVGRTATSSEMEASAGFGIEGTLDWTNTAFTEKTFGAVEFIPSDKTSFSVNARTSIAMSATAVSLDFDALEFDRGDPVFTSSAELNEFAIRIFKALQLNFDAVTFYLKEDGSTEFNVDLRDAEFSGPLAFIQNLKDILGKLFKDSGVKLEVTPQRVTVSQNIEIPPRSKNPSKPTPPFFIGPAQITDLVISWAVRIPLTKSGTKSEREALTAAFGLASKSAPMTIYVPPMYGGRMFALMEVTTKGIRLFEVSFEYGAFATVQWGPAIGTAGLMAGVYFLVKKGHCGNETFILSAFINAFAKLDVARIIYFSGLIRVELRYKSADQCASGHKEQTLTGEARVKVSTKIGLVKVSYRFTYAHTENVAGIAGAECGETIGTGFPDLSGGAPDNSGIFAKNRDRSDMRRDRLAWSKLVGGYGARGRTCH